MLFPDGKTTSPRCFTCPKYVNCTNRNYNVSDGYWKGVYSTFVEPEICITQGSMLSFL